MIAMLVFGLSCLLIAYVLAGYPLLLGWLARRGPRAVRKQFTPRTVTVLLPVRNGGRWLAGKLDSLLGLDYPRELVDILVISDGSTDQSDAIALGYAAHGVRLLRVPPGGKAAALNAGLAEARGDILFFTDVRQPLDPASLRELVACLGDPEVGAASGELYIRSGNLAEEANVGLYWKYEKSIRRRQSQVDSLLGATGAIYAMRRELAVRLEPGTLLDDVELPLGAFFAGYRVVFEEKARAWDDPTALGAEFRRKVRTLAGNYQLLWHWPQLLRADNRMRLHFLSHKMGRLALPFALLAIAGSTPWLPDPLRLLAAGGQAGLYGAGAADLLIGEGNPCKRLTSPARTFLVMMGAAFCATSILFRPRGDFWKPAAGAAPGAS